MTSPEPADLASLDGAVRPASETVIPVADEGFIRGDGAFEVVRVYHGTLFAMDQHFDRLEGSARRLRLPMEVDRRLLQQEADELLDARGGQDFDGCLRIIMTRGGRRLLMTEPLPEAPDRVRLGFVTYSPTRVLDGVKSLSYAANMLSSRLARERGFDEALMVTPHGRVLEAPTSSVFWAGEDGVLRTPPLDDHILASITRALVMQVVEVVETSATPDDLTAAKEAFLASTAREVHSVAAIEETEFPEIGPRTREAAEAVGARIAEALAASRAG